MPCENFLVEECIFTESHAALHALYKKSRIFGSFNREPFLHRFTTPRNSQADDGKGEHEQIIKRKCQDTSGLRSNITVYC